jgi:thymidylate synthase (FAD)
MDNVIKVLDHGYVKYIDHMGSDRSVIEAARMSTNKGFEGWDKDAKLLRYLYENKHMTPFECGGELQVEIQAPIFVFRQIMRHRTFSFNELSARYTMMPNLHYIPSSDRLTKQSKSNKQGSSENQIDDYYKNNILKNFNTEQQDIFDNYIYSVDEANLSREVARINTPVSRYSRIRAKTDLRNWLHFLSLRMHPHAQWETREFAKAAAIIIKELFPRTYNLFDEYTLNSISISKTEKEELNKFISYICGSDASNMINTYVKDCSGNKNKIIKVLKKIEVV